MLSFVREVGFECAKAGEKPKFTVKCGKMRNSRGLEPDQRKLRITP